MKLVRGVLRSVNVCLSHRSQWPVRAFSIGSNSGTDYNQSNNSFEPADDFERRIFGDISGSSATSNSFYQKLDRIQNARGRFDFASKFNVRNSSEPWDSLDETFNTLSDGMGEKLKKAATDFDIDAEEMENEDFAFRPDMEFPPVGTYKHEDLDLTKSGVRRPFRGPELDVTSEEVMKKADFRNVRFLANFITEAGIIIKRNKTKISAKAQRKVAREIKTARAFGLMPFTTMGTKHFVFGSTMEALDKDYEYDVYDAPNSVDMDANGDPVAE